MSKSKKHLVSVVEPTVAAGDQENPEVPILKIERNLMTMTNGQLRKKVFKQIKIDFPIETI